MARFQPMRSLADTTPFLSSPPRPSLLGLILSPEVQNSNSTKNGYFEVSFGFQNISNGFLDLNKSQLRKIYLFPMVSKSPLRNPLEMFWKPKESSNCGKVCKNEEKMETFTNNASRMTLDPKKMSFYGIQNKVGHHRQVQGSSNQRLLPHLIA